MRRLIAITLLALPATALAQQGAHTVAPGMTRAEVVAALGTPSTVRTAGAFTYLFYTNHCGRACGMNDVVILRRDSVSDAIFRSPDRRYIGTSSSPEQSPPERSARPAPRAAKPMTIRKHDSAATKPAGTPPATSAAATAATPTQMKPPAKAHDTSPSIPAHPHPLAPAPDKPAPAKSPATDTKKPG